MVKKIKYKLLFLLFFSYFNPVYGTCETVTNENFEKLVRQESPVTLVFFSSWCADCKEELLKIKNKKVTKENYILINTFDSPGKGEKSLKIMEINNFCIYDKQRTLAKKYQVNSVPKSVLISKF